MVTKYVINTPTKNWKITSKDKEFITWKKGNQSIELEKLIGTQESGWAVHYSKDSHKYFKTKSQAIKFANAYMRSH